MTALAVSVALFWRRFGRVMSKIHQAKPDADFQFAPIGRRMDDFIWEVLLQGKVIREHPWPGFGARFCVLGVLRVCSGHRKPSGHWIRLPLSLSALERTGESILPLWPYSRSPWLFPSPVSLSGRFFARPKWLGKLSYESGVIALLIFVLMITYLAAFRIGDSNAAAKPLWWAHTLALLIFLPLIPHTKYLHLVLRPVTVFLSRGAFSRIPPLSGDEDFGLDTGKDLTRIVVLQVYSCVECSGCTEYCPAANTGKVLTRLCLRPTRCISVTLEHRA
jgi:hypothetical protein